MPNRDPNRSKLGERRPFEVQRQKDQAESDITKLFARLFTTEEGRKVLTVLANETAGMVVPAGQPTEILQRMEGKRELVADIFDRVHRGMK